MIRWQFLFYTLLCLLSLLVTQPVVAHEGALPPPQSLLPACRAARTTCSLTDLSRRDFGVVRPFPPDRKILTPQPGLDSARVREQLEPLSDVPCTNGFAELYPCKNVDLLAFIPIAQLGDTAGNTLWGWTDPATKDEYVIAGVTNGTVFVNITTPTSPRIVGKLATQSNISLWRDMKVYDHYAYIVSDFNPDHGMQIFDLAQLSTITSTTPVTLTATGIYTEFESAHNLVINEASGFAYAVGSETCLGGLHMIDLSQPITPTYAGCYAGDGYVHDAQCVMYDGPDADYTGRELCFSANGNYTDYEQNKLTVIDVTDKQHPERITTMRWTDESRGYQMGYAHQSWLTEDQAYMLLDDEYDEMTDHHNARTYIFDVRDLDEPVLMGDYTARFPAIDHNIYISGTYAYQANYTAGLRVLDLENVATAQLREVGYFDTYPSNNEPDFTGAWSPYPFFPSGVVAVNTIDRGLFLLKPRIPALVTDDQQLFMPVVERNQ